MNKHYTLLVEAALNKKKTLKKAEKKENKNAPPKDVHNQIIINPEDKTTGGLWSR